MSEVKLKRCPFCGGEAYVSNEDCYGNVDEYYLVHCTECGLQLGFTNQFCTEEEAIKYWNTRKPIREIVERLEREKVNKIFAGRSNGKTLKTGINYGIATAIEIVKEVGGTE